MRPRLQLRQALLRRGQALARGAAQRGHLRAQRLGRLGRRAHVGLQRRLARRELRLQLGDLRAPPPPPLRARARQAPGLLGLTCRQSESVSGKAACMPGPAAALGGGGAAHACTPARALQEASGRLPRLGAPLRWSPSQRPSPRSAAQRAPTS
jgi:hypothetical protein